MGWGTLILLVVLATAIGWPILAERRRTLPDTRRAPGEMLPFPPGATHARWHGPARGPVVVAVHGLTTPSPVWDSLAAALGELGYRVLAYDLYGHGYSANAPGPQGPDLHERQLDALLDHYALTEDVTLMGYSMGGAIATRHAAAHPERIKRLVLVAPAGLAVAETPLERFCRETPFIGDWLFALAAPWRIVAQSSTGGSEVPGLAAVAAGELRRRGYLAAVLSSMRHMVSLRLEPEHRAIARAEVPVVAIWGADDSRIPAQAVGLLSLWNRQAKQEVIPGAGHGVVHTHGRAVAAVLRDVLREDWA